MGNEQEQLQRRFDPLVWIFFGASGLVGILLAIRTAIACIFLIAGLQVFAKDFNLSTSMILLACGFAAVGQLPFCLRDDPKELPKIRYAILALISSTLGLLFAGVLVYGMISSDLAVRLPEPHYFWVIWGVITIIYLNDTVLLFYSLIFAIPKSRKLLTETVKKLSKKRA